jgi:autotransporter-associated beta strand protein
MRRTNTLIDKGEWKMKKTENQIEQVNLADLEPGEEVKGGAKVGAGHLILPNANTYTGQTTVKINGNLQIADLTSAAIDPR